MNTARCRRDGGSRGARIGLGRLGLKARESYENHRHQEHKTVDRHGNVDGFSNSKPGQQDERRCQRPRNGSNCIDGVEGPDLRTHFGVMLHGMARQQRQRRAHEAGGHHDDQERGDQIERRNRKWVGLGEFALSAKQHNEELCCAGEGHWNQ